MRKTWDQGMCLELEFNVNFYSFHLRKLRKNQNMSHDKVFNEVCYKFQLRLQKVRKGT